MPLADSSAALLPPSKVVVWAAALIAVAVAVSALLVGKINNKAKGINF